MWCITIIIALDNQKRVRCSNEKFKNRWFSFFVSLEYPTIQSYISCFSHSILFNCYVVYSARGSIRANEYFRFYMIYSVFHSFPWTSTSKFIFINSVLATEYFVYLIKNASVESWIHQVLLSYRLQEGICFIPIKYGK